MPNRMITVIETHKDGTVDKSTRIGSPADEHMSKLPIKLKPADVDMVKEVKRKLLKKKE